MPRSGCGVWRSVLDAYAYTPHFSIAFHHLQTHNSLDAHLASLGALCCLLFFAPGERMLQRRRQQIRQMKGRNRYFALRRLLHGGRQATSLLPAHSLDQAEKPNLHLKACQGTAHNQALGFHEPRITRTLGVAEEARVDQPEIESLPVLYRRVPVRVQQIALVKNGVRDLLDG